MRPHALLPLAVCTALLTAAAPLAALAQPRPSVTGLPPGPGGGDPTLFRSPQLDPLSLVMAYHRMNGTTVDFRPLAERSAAYQNATTFDRPDILTREIARLEAQFAAVDLTRVYVIRINTQLRQYDGGRGGYAIALGPDSFISMADPVTYRGFGLGFRNLDDVGFMAVGDTAAARVFAQRFSLNMQAESAGEVLAELAYRLAEAPPGLGGGPTLVRADVLAARIVTRTGQVMWDFGQTAAGGAGAPTTTAPGTLPLLRAADVQGLRLGMPTTEGTAIASRAYPTERSRGERGGRWFRGIAAGTEVPLITMGGGTSVARCGGDPLPIITGADIIAYQQMGYPPNEYPIADTSEACLGYDAAQGDSPLPAGTIGRIVSGQRLAGSTAASVRAALTEKYGPTTYARDGGATLQWIGRDPARPDGGLVSITARIEPRRDGGVVLGVIAVPYADPNAPPKAAPAPGAAPPAAGPRL